MRHPAARDIGKAGGMTTQILVGDVFEQLATLPDESVYCVVTSPPYWGLRDYGTASWDGGDRDCDHLAPARGGISPATSSKQLTHAGTLTYQYTGKCGKCGARRVDRQLGMEPTLAEHIATMVDVFRQVRRVLRKDGTVWLNYGDCYATSPNGRSAADTKATGNDDRTFRDKPFSTIGGTLKPKDLCMIPNRLAIALQDDGWWVRSEIIWSKPNPMPESVTDRPATAHEKVWLLTKSARYFYDAEAVRTEAKAPYTKMPDGWDTGPGAHGSFHRGGREKGAKVDKQIKITEGRKHGGGKGLYPLHRSPHPSGGQSLASDPSQGATLRNVWTIATHAYSEAHFATFPPALVEPCIKAGTSEKGCCAECGAPWVRETVSQQVSLQATNGPEKQEAVTNWDRSQYPRTRKISETTGWSPSCKCDAATVPCTVLDPFGGSGTTAMVADRLGRNAILIELNPEYAELARKRIHDDAGMFAEVS